MTVTPTNVNVNVNCGWVGRVRARAGVHYVNGTGDAGVPLTKRTVEVRNVNAARENVIALT